MALEQTRQQLQSNFLKDEESPHTGYCRALVNLDIADVALVDRFTGGIVSRLYDASAGTFGSWTELPDDADFLALGAGAGTEQDYYELAVLLDREDELRDAPASGTGKDYVGLVRGRADVRFGGLTRTGAGDITDAHIQDILRRQGIEVSLRSSLAQQVVDPT